MSSFPKEVWLDYATSRLEEAKAITAAISALEANVITPEQYENLWSKTYFFRRSAERYFDSLLDALGRHGYNCILIEESKK